MKETTRLLIFIEQEGDELLIDRQICRCVYSVEVTFTRNLSDGMARLGLGNWDLFIIMADCGEGIKAMIKRFSAVVPILIVSRHSVVPSLYGSRSLLRREMTNLLPMAEVLMGKAVPADEAEALSEKRLSNRKTPFFGPAVLFRLSGQISEGEAFWPKSSTWSGGVESLLGYDDNRLMRRPDLFLRHLNERDRRSLMRRLHRLIRRSGQSVWVGFYEGVERRRRMWILGVCRRLSGTEYYIDGLIADVEPLFSMHIDFERTLKNKEGYLLSLEMAREEERERIAREIHDELANGLLGAWLDLSLAMRSDMSETTRARLKRVGESIQMTMDSARRIARNLRPGILRDFGLVEALRYYAEGFQEKSGIVIEFSANRSFLPLDDKAVLTLFRIQQEALANIAKHAAASRAVVSLNVDNDRVRLTIDDDGIGVSDFDLTKPKSMGMETMKERANLSGGTLLIGKSAMGGCRVTVELPLR